MKIKDLLNFHAFQGAEFKDYVTCERIIDQEKEIKDIHSIQINEKVEYLRPECKYSVLDHWLTVYLILEENYV